MSSDNKNSQNSASDTTTGGYKSIVNVVETMQKVDTTSKKAKQNATSMKDGQGRSIEYSEDDYQPKRFTEHDAKSKKMTDTF